jgi:tight adherence protein B
MSNALLPFVVMAGTMLTLLLLFGFFGGAGTVPAKRLGRVGGLTTHALDGKADGLTLKRSTMDSAIPLLDNLIKSLLPYPDKLRKRLARTGRNITLGEYLIVNALLVGVFFLVFVYIVHWAKPMSFFMGIAVGLYLPHMIINRMGNKRIAKFLGAFPESIDTICRGLRSGLPITECISSLGAEAPYPLNIEFSRISDAVRMGRSIEEAMWEVEARLDAPEFRFFIIALSIQRETGGNLAETLGNLGDLLRKRRQLLLKIRAMSSEARASAMIIGSLPFLMFTLLFFVNHDYVMLLLNTRKGEFMLGGGMTWLSLGVFVMKQMVNFKI